MIEPFLKWPGGKRWLVNRHLDLFPKKYGRYVEPFLGGAAVFFALGPKQALLSDTNGELVNVYNCIRDRCQEVENELLNYQRQHSSDFYYQVREQAPKDALGRAVQFIYLNRTCFNGIYRVNKEGRFNVPMGTKTAVSFRCGFLEEIALVLQQAQILELDFETAINRTERGDFVFVDPPYTVMHNNNGFVKYNAQLFSWEDQARLAATIKAASRRGVKVMMSNANHVSVRSLYEGFGCHHTLSRSSVLAGLAHKRQPSTELLITSY